MPRQNTKKSNRNNRKRRLGGGDNHQTPPNKKRRFNNNKKKNDSKGNKLSPEEKKSKCIAIMKTFKEILDKESMDLMQLNQINESDLGIELFINNIADKSKGRKNNKQTSHKPIIGNLKHKLQDFIVSEIDESGKVAKITNTDSVKREGGIDKSQSMVDAIKQVEQELNKLLNKKNTKKFLIWYKNGIKIKHNMDEKNQFKKKDETASDDEDDEDDDIEMDKKKDKDQEIENYRFPKSKDKQQRKKMHEILKHLPYTITTTADGCVEVKIVQSKYGRGAHLKFVLTKVGITTKGCLDAISTKLDGKSIETFNYAGAKDKNAITSQYVTAYHVTCDELKKATKDINKIKVGNFEYVDEEIKLGSLDGNQFEIAVRKIRYQNQSDPKKTKNNKSTVAVPEKELISRIKMLKQKGFINYFGSQRLGQSTVGPHDIGRAIVQSKLGLACALLLCPRSHSNEEIRNQKEEFIKTGDIKKWPRRLHSGKRVIRGLMEDGNNYNQALMKIPRNVRTMYTHAYQSYLWNHLVSFRIKEHGYKVMVGDVVRDKEDKNKFEHVTSDNIKNYNIFDVVLPLAGSDVKMPKDKVKDVGDFMVNLLKKDGLELDDFAKLDESWGLDINYRNIMVKPINVKGVVKMYSDDDEYLIDAPFVTEEGKAKDWSMDDGNKDKVGWVVTFGLPKSSHANMCLRQLLSISSDQLFTFKFPNKNT